MGAASAEIELGAFYAYNMTFCGSNCTNFPFFICISTRLPPLWHEAQGLARLPQRTVLVMYFVLCMCYQSVVCPQVTMCESVRALYTAYKAHTHLG